MWDKSKTVVSYNKYRSRKNHLAFSPYKQLKGKESGVRGKGIYWRVIVEGGKGGYVRANVPIQPIVGQEIRVSSILV